MPDFIRKMVRRLISLFKKDFIYGQKTYAQEGEDLILRRLIQEGVLPEKGIYIDVGCNHPMRLSNTYILYRKGWRGIVIDPNTMLCELFEQHRPYDTVFNLGIDETPSELTYYKFANNAINTFDAQIAKENSEKQNATCTTETIQVRPLAEIEEIQNLSSVDMLSIDVEGMDLNVLKSLDWDKHCPTVIIVEQLNQEIETILNTDISNFLKSKGYIMFSKLYHSSIFVLQRKMKGHL